MKGRVCLMILLVWIGFGCRNDAQKSAYTAVVEGKLLKIPALTGGKILAMNVEQGKEVQKDDILAIIDTTELDHQRQQLKASQRALRAQRNIAHHQLALTKNEYLYLQEKKERIRALYLKNSTSRQNLDDLLHKLDQARTTLKTVEHNFQSINAQYQRIQAQLKTVNKKIHDATIKAPADGIISEKFYEIGEAIHPISPLIELLNLRKVETKIYIANEQIANIQYGQTVRVRIDGIPQELTGKIIWISPKAEFTPKFVLTRENRTSLVYAVKIEIDNPNHLLKHGMPIEIKL